MEANGGGALARGTCFTRSHKGCPYLQETRSVNFIKVPYCVLLALVFIWTFISSRIGNGNKKSTAYSLRLIPTVYATRGSLSRLQLRLFHSLHGVADAEERRSTAAFPWHSLRRRLIGQAWRQITDERRRPSRFDAPSRISLVLTAGPGYVLSPSL